MWTDTARERSQELVERFCIECQAEFYVPRHSAGKSRRCPRCQEAYTEGRRKAAREAQESKRRGRILKRPPVTMRLVHDPRGMWGPGTELTRPEVNDLLRLGYLTPGERWDYEGAVYVVEKCRMTGRLELRECTLTLPSPINGRGIEEGG